MQITFQGEKAIFSGEFMDPGVIFDCGQCFRFLPAGDGVYTGVAYGKRLFASTATEHFAIWPVTPEAVEAIWRRYFDLDLDYAKLEADFCSDSVLRRAVPHCRGMRLLNQEPFEALIASILSANNNIARIRRIIEAICCAAGERHVDAAGEYYAFPTPEALSQLSEEALRACGAGYRAAYVAEAAWRVCDGFDLSAIAALEYDAARERLMELKGVGGKVADCVLLFALGKRVAFPADVWIRRVLCTYYGFVPKNDRQLAAFAAEHFGPYAGIAQQYLFHYARLQNLGGQENLS